MLVIGLVLFIFLALLLAAGLIMIIAGFISRKKTPGGGKTLLVTGIIL